MKQRENSSENCGKRLSQKKLRGKLRQAKKEHKLLLEKTRQADLELERLQEQKIDQEIDDEIFKKPENTERAKMEAELLNMHHWNMIFLRSLNDSQYDGKVIAGEEALNKLEKFLAQRRQQKKAKKQKENDDNKKHDETIVHEVVDKREKETSECAKHLVDKTIDESLEKNTSDFVNSPRKTIEKKVFNSKQSETSKPAEDKESRKKTVEPSTKSQVVERMENTKDQEPTPDTKEREGVRENKAVEATTSTRVDNDMENRDCQVHYISSSSGSHGEYE
ncbi:cilia- and flagella-associated protein 53-like [Acropora millepora]|uniref:cilia- and flagella-associated protein 53-like n=1 Tax=Acropora millepora TaxID=45264 RepID=UPI001CF12D41|nr:cilia- and flagella-associated protein 53-like [Acropora millepora]